MGAGIDRDKWGEGPDGRAAEGRCRPHQDLGGFTPFVGELKDTKGQVRLAAGKTMTDMELYNWDWSVEGVQGLTK